MASIACCSPRSPAARDGFNCAAARAPAMASIALHPCSPRWPQLPAAAQQPAMASIVCYSPAARHAFSCCSGLRAQAAGMTL
ncbi:hypothetical protein VFPBJ_08326 [Purpureocillium lilacinum]|uniref:Uncharacterized protein n=1 Tax=Purpureocillium lilacinum TaxID=33203 RepID=A0A179GDP8_PURLI|nr:hypothetical protein VFPBJ_08326 [Purpureocillium lilacinum]